MRRKSNDEKGILLVIIMIVIIFVTLIVILISSIRALAKLYGKEDIPEFEITEGSIIQK